MDNSIVRRLGLLAQVDFLNTMKGQDEFLTRAIQDRSNELRLRLQEKVDLSLSQSISEERTGTPQSV